MRLHSAALTDVGRKRDHNEDAFLADDSSGLYAVADGMGGHAAGEVASGLAIDVLKKIPRAVAAARLVGTLRIIHDVILKNMTAHQERRGMGTTLTAAFLSDYMLYISHVGDSAAYLMRDWKVQRLTEDQSRGHMLLQCLGGRAEFFDKAQYVEMAVQPHDILVLCSDGLTNYIETDQNIAELYMSPRTLNEYASDLVQHALSSGGQDNVTVVVIEVL